MTHASPAWPRITVVTPSFNQGEFIEETIRSVLDQQYPNLEYIIIDGGSSDASPAIIRRYEGSLAYWRSAPDRGQSHAINEGFERATGDILCWLNSDDFLAPGALRIVADRFRESPDTQWLIGAANEVHADGRLLRTVRPVAVDSTTLFMWPERFFCQQSTFWRRELWTLAGPLREELRYTMDLALWSRMLRHAAPVFEPAVLASSRHHDGSKTLGNQGHAARHETFALIREMLRQSGRQLLGNDARREVARFLLRWSRTTYEWHEESEAAACWLAAMKLQPAAALTPEGRSLAIRLAAGPTLRVAMGRLRHWSVGA